MTNPARAYVHSATTWSIVLSVLMIIVGILGIVALLIWATWPSSIGWVLGTLVGVSMFVRGISRLALSLAVRRAVA